MNRETVLKEYAANLFESLPEDFKPQAQGIHREIGNWVRLAAFFRGGGDQIARRAALRSTILDVRALRTGARLAKMFDLHTVRVSP